MKSAFFGFFFERLLMRAAGLSVVWVVLSGSAQTNDAIIPVEFKHGHVMAPAQVQRSNTVWLMLDTGFTITMIEPRLAELLNLEPRGKTTIAGIAGQEWADVFEGPTFEFGSASYTPRRVAALPSERNRRSKRLEGVLGAGFFRRFVVEIDSKKRTLKLHEPDDYHYSGPGTIVPLRLKNSTPVVEAVINIPGRAPIRGQFEVDTGCNGALCLGQDFVEVNRLLDTGGPVQRGGRSGVGGDAQTKVGSVPQLQLGDLTVEKPEVNFFLRGSPVEPGHAGHIGMEVLKQFKTIFDYSRQQLILERPNEGGNRH